MRLDVAADVRQADELLGDIERRLASSAPLHLLGDLVTDYQREVFATSGHGTWAPDDPVTLAEKAGGRVLVDTGALMDALTGGATISGDSVEVHGTDYARFLKAGARGMPPRDPSPEPPASEVDRWAHTLLGFLTTGRRR